MNIEIDIVYTIYKTANKFLMNKPVKILKLNLQNN